MTVARLDEVLQLLHARGVDARRRDWALGRTVAVPGGARYEQDGILAWERVVWVVEDRRLAVFHPDLGTLARTQRAPEAVLIALAAVGEGWMALAASAVHVRVAQALVVRGRGYVFVDRLDAERELVLDAGSTLDGCLLEPWLAQPRALGVVGRQLPHRFAFVLRDAGDLALFAPAQVRVLLSGSARSAAGIAATM